MQQDQIKGCRIGRAEIGRVRNELEMCEFAEAHLVQDLPGLLVTVIVGFDRLKSAQYVERAAGEIGIDVSVLQCRDQGVAAEQRDEPGDGRDGCEFEVMRSLDRQSQRGHVLHCLPV